MEYTLCYGHRDVEGKQAWQCPCYKDESVTCSLGCEPQYRKKTQPVGIPETWLVYAVNCTFEALQTKNIIIYPVRIDNTQEKVKQFQNFLQTAYLTIKEGA